MINIRKLKPVIGQAILSRTVAVFTMINNELVKLGQWSPHGYHRTSYNLISAQNT